MKQFIKNNLKVFVSIFVTTIIVGSVSVYAASQYFAKDISFTPTNENFKKENGESIDNVEDALNQLYEINDYDFSSNDTEIAYYMGNRANGKNVTITLEKGKYIVIAVNSHALASSSKFNSKGEFNTNRLTVTKGSCTLIKGYYTAPTATNLTASDKYVSNFTYSQIYECELNDEDTIIYTTNDGNYSDCSQTSILQSVKLK